MSSAVASVAARTRPAAELRRARAAVAFTFAVAGMLFGSWVPRIPEMKDRLDLSSASLGLALLAPSIGAIIAMSLAGGAASRLGSARTTRWLTVYFLVLGWLPGLSMSLPMLWGLLFAWGIGVGGMDVAMNAQAVTVEKAYRRPVMSGFHAAWSVGSLVGAGVGTLGATTHVPIAAQQGVFAAILLVAAVFASRFFHPDPIDGSRPTPEAGTARRSNPLAVLNLRLVLLGVAALTAMLSEGAVADWSGILLRDNLHAAASHVGLAYAAFMAAETIGRLVGDRVVLRLGRVRAVGGLSALGAVGLAAGLATGSVAGAVIGFAVLGVGLAVTVPVAFSSAADGTAGAGPGIAAVSSLAYTGFLAGPTAIGLVAQASSVPAALWLVPVVTAAGGALAVLAIRRPV